MAISFEIKCKYIGETLDLEKEKEYFYYYFEPVRGPITITIFDNDIIALEKSFTLDEKEELSLFTKENFKFIDE